MKTFREFVADQDFAAIKKIVLDIQDPQDNTIDDDSTSILSRPLSDFKLRKNLLSAPNLTDIINDKANRGAIVAAIKNPSTTIGNLLQLLTAHDEEETPIQNYGQVTWI